MPPYHNITISGVAGTGSTTLLALLRDHLEPIGWTGYSGGEYMRRFVANLPDGVKHHDSRDYGEEVDRQVDMDIRRQLSEQQGLIIESWLSGFMAQGIAGVLKILVVCTDDLERARRLAGRDNMQPKDAMLHAFERLEANVARWSRMYAPEWQAWVVETGRLPPDAAPFFWNPKLYDMVIDTAAYSPADCLAMTLEKLGMPLPI